MAEERKKVQTHRFYEQKYPKENDLVVVEVVKIEENCCYVQLLEYNRIEGMITPNEMTKQMQQVVSKVLKVGKQEVVQVLRVDEEKGYIDLSKKKVRNNQEAACLDYYSKAKTVNSILITICESNKNITIEELYTKLVWPFSKQYRSSYEAFRFALNDNSLINDFTIPEEIKAKLLVEIQRRLAPQNLRIKAEIELRCYEYEGVEAIKAALFAGEQKSRNNCVVRFEIVGSPVYAGTINTQDKTLGLEVIKEALKAVEETILQKNGQYKLRGEPKIYGDKTQDDIELIEKPEEDEEEEEQKEGDDEDEDSEVEGMGDADDYEEDEQQ